MTDRTKLRIAFIGGGQMAHQHAAAIRRSGHGAQIVGVHDSAPERAEAFAAATASTTYATTAELLSTARPDVVHVCTPPAAHFGCAVQVLEAGAHVYVEKPFTLSRAHAETVLDTAARRGRLVCAGHQLLRDPAFTRLTQGAWHLGTPVQIDSHFAFRPVGMSVSRTASNVLADMLLDILPHPLYALVAMFERFAQSRSIEVSWVEATPTDLHAILRAGDATGRLSVSLRARPVASSITLMGTAGSLTCDFARSMTVGTANPGTEALEKLLNPVVEGAGLVAHASLSAARRVLAGTGYAGLVELIGAFHHAAITGGPSPTSPEHLLTVTSIFEQLATKVHAACPPQPPVGAAEDDTSELFAVTGASGFLGAEIARALPRVRAIGRRPPAGGAAAAEWVTADLARGLDADALRGVDVVIHAAAETAGGFSEHQRNSLDATNHLLQAMFDVGVSRLVFVSSLSVIRPPTTAWERQTEHTPRPADPKRYGPYTWGKCQQEAMVEERAHALGIAVRIVRPGALIDRAAPDLPGLVGRRLFGSWHLGLGRPGLPTAVCDVDTCAAAVAWCATHFDQAPPIVNLFDPQVPTRRELLSLLRTRGWKGRMLWVPISVVAAGLISAQTAVSLLQGRRPARLAAWSILRPRRYDGNLAVQLLTASHQAAKVSAKPLDQPVAV